MISQASISKVKNALDNDKQYSSSRVGKCGRKRIISPRTERKLVQLVKNNRRLTSKDLRKNLEQYGVNVCDSTVHRKLIDAGLHARRPWCSSEGERTATQLKTAYENYKRIIKKAAADDKAELHKTGGGSFKRKLDVDGERLIAKLHHNFTPLCNLCDSDDQYQVIEDVDADPVSYIESVETYFDGPLPVMSVEEVQTESHEEVVAHETVLSPSQSPSVNIPEAITTAGLQQQMQITSTPTARKHKRNRMEDYTSSKVDFNDLSFRIFVQVFVWSLNRRPIDKHGNLLSTTPNALSIQLRVCISFRTTPTDLTKHFRTYDIRDFVYIHFHVT
ncbi:hypothetical protein ANN_03353 [Periplaneta americana]|uniref:Transposase Tc1-like domain-containing protein n=1 Tax=Periplaneta americana TaxID=6978 RepID=A0ABQ8U465_PERAM|nr:hypothetical protein ANN_03353 [Periplaneta americana]